MPLTTSLYVPGKLASTQTVLVDVGTGFYVEKVCFSFLSWPKTWIGTKERGGGADIEGMSRRPKQHGSFTPPRSRSWGRTCRSWRALCSRRMGS